MQTRNLAEIVRTEAWDNALEGYEAKTLAKARGVLDRPMTEKEIYARFAAVKSKWPDPKVPEPRQRLARSREFSRGDIYGKVGLSPREADWDALFADLAEGQRRWELRQRSKR